MQPTTFAPTSLNFDSGLRTAANLPVVASSTAVAAAVPAQLVLPEKFPLNLTADQTTALLTRVENFEFEALPLQDFSTLSQQPTLNLNRALDAFMARINKAENPQLFKLVDKRPGHPDSGCQAESRRPGDWLFQQEEAAGKPR
jgi:hypothetical protein